MAQPTTEHREPGSSVLSRLDERKPTAFYWQLTLLALPVEEIVRVFERQQRDSALPGG